MSDAPAEADATAPPPLINDRIELSNWLASEENEGHVVQTRLKASERVIARVTDGIYREPASALRELISNAWDADANQVTILTDAPRFSRIYVRDDGAGMSYKTLCRLLHMIGGSAKRREEGQELGVTAEDDPERTPKGRLLIGKIGIGLFSVSQLSRRFRIITKTRDTNYRLIADVRLRAYSEDSDDDDDQTESDDTFVTGDVFITREHSDDVAAHGTDIVLDDIKPRVRDLLRSADRWRSIEEKNNAWTNGDLDTWASIRTEEPQYHSGWIGQSTGSDRATVLSTEPNLPWSVEDPPEIRMGRLMDAVEHEFTRMERPDLEKTLDTYLETLWNLALAVPVPYVDKHPFDLTTEDDIRLFWLSNETRGQAQEIDLQPGVTVRDSVRRNILGAPELTDGEHDPAGGFSVHLDGVELRRPIRFRFIRTERRGLDKTMFFVGKYNPDLGRVSRIQRGGGLALEGYLFWNGRVVPKENNGVLIRIRGSSGAAFDPTFFKYQISEQTRLRQITSELFIQKGLDAALNIDRESFNFSHPHVQLVTNWMHRALRQLTNRHKELSGRAREDRRSEDSANRRDAVLSHSEQVWRRVRGAEPQPDIQISTDRESAQRARSEGYVALSRPDLPTLGSQQAAARAERDARAVALTRVLAAYGILEDRPYDEQQALIEAILRVFFDE